MRRKNRLRPSRPTITTGRLGRRGRLVRRRFVLLRRLPVPTGIKKARTSRGGGCQDLDGHGLVRVPVGGVEQPTDSLANNEIPTDDDAKSSWMRA
jgi:hypothetical protein